MLLPIIKLKFLGMKNSYFLVVGLIVGQFMLQSCGGGNSNQTPANTAVPVNTYKVTVEQVTGKDSYPGRVVATSEVELRAQVSGYITDIYIKDGQKVSKGQKLYEIDRTKYQAAYNQARANLQSAKANLERIKKDVERYKTLNEKEAIAKQRVDYAEADLQTAKAQVAAAEASLSSASTDLNYSLINAPFSGTIGISQVKIGSQVSPGQTLLNTISSDGPVAVDFVINEREIPRFNNLQKGTQPDSLFTLNLSNVTQYPYPGKLTAIDRAVGTQTGTVTVRLNFPNPDGLLIPGMTVTVMVLNQDIGKQVIIPFKAVTEQMSEYFVYKVAGDSVVQQKINLGTQLKDFVVVREGLEEGDNIVVEGTQRLRHGAKVQLETPAAQPSAKK